MQFSKIIPKKFSTQLIIVTIVAGMVPVCVVVILLALLVNQLTFQISSVIIKKQNEQWLRSKQPLMLMIEDRARQKALDVALQLDLYLQSHRHMTVKDLQNNREFGEIAFQPLGEEGSTAAINSETLMFLFQKRPGNVIFNESSLTEHPPEMTAIIERSRGGKYAYGYYKKKERNANTQDVFIYIVPMNVRTGDGARLSVAAIAYVDEFTRPFQMAQDVSFATTQYLIHAEKQTIKSLKNTGLILVAVGILLISLFSYWIGVYFSRIIIRLRQATKAVNEGNFDKRIEYSDTGELGELIYDFNEMASRLQKTTVSKEHLEASEQKLIEANAELIKEIHEREQAEAKYRSIFENALEGIFQTTPEGCFINANPACAKIYGYSSPQEMIEKITDLGRQLYVSNEDRERLKELLIRNNIVEGFEVQHYRKDASKIWVSINASLLPDSSGQITFNGFMQDITERKIAEEEKKHLEFQLRQAQKMEAIGTLAGGIAHDFNNILGAILGYSEMALYNNKLGGRPRQYVEQIFQSGERARDLVKQILTFSRRQEQERKQVLIAPIIKEGIRMLRSSLPSTIQIIQNVSETPLTILADSTQIHQVLMNLCTNAAQAMREKGGILEIQLFSEIVEVDRKFHPFNLRAGSYVKLVVSDNGCGIEASVMEKIFDPFFTTKGPGEGTGLGLSVVYGIIRDHGGAVDITSNPAKGTTVTVYFPLIDQPKTTIRQDKSEPITGGGEHILFVDDEAALAKLGSILLTHFGYYVTYETSSVDALAIFKADPKNFDLVITDMTMPNMRGDRLALELLKIRPDIPIILCTGFGDVMSADKAKALGIREFMMKPVSKQDLANTVREVLKGNKRCNFGK